MVIARQTQSQWNCNGKFLGCGGFWEQVLRHTLKAKTEVIQKIKSPNSLQFLKRDAYRVGLILIVASALRMQS